ncbi:MAG: hypothetical protein EAZ55_03600 [Cytophagales bacterium]|nr:MAG: hypothetical protein EAZ55_03600 [Cytophagales bacterium]
MVSFFKINATYKLIILFLLFLALRAPALWYNFPLTQQELVWISVANKMMEGEALYSHIWVHISPIAAFIYWLTMYIANETLLVYRIMAAVLIFLQALFINQLFMQRDVFPERTLLPAIIYIFLSSLYIDSFILTPALLANTALIWVLNLIFYQVNEKRKQNVYFAIGAYLGLAGLIYLPNFLLIIVPLFVFTLYSNAQIQNYIGLFFAYFFAILISFLVFYLGNREADFFVFFFYAIFIIPKQFQLYSWEFLYLFAYTLVLIFMTFSVLSTAKRYNNYQNRCQSASFIWLLVSIPSVLLLDLTWGANLLVSLIPVITFLLTHFFLTFKNILLKEVLFLVLIFNCTFFYYDSVWNIGVKYLNNEQVWIHPESTLLDAHPEAEVFKGKKIVVLGYDTRPYQYGYASTPYFNWYLAGSHWEHLDKYNRLIDIHKAFMSDLPDVIVDQEGKAKKLFSIAPTLAAYYEPYQKNKNIYIRK